MFNLHTELEKKYDHKVRSVETPNSMAVFNEDLFHNYIEYSDDQLEEINC